MSEQKSVWIDMTDLSSWQGHFTGIQRVVYNIAKGYHDSGEAKYFTFNPANKTFHEFDFTGFIKVIEQTPEIRNEVVVSRKAAVKNKAKQVYARTPESIKRYATPQRLKIVAKTGYAHYQRVEFAKSKLRKLYRTGQEIKTVQFGKNDKIIILGNTWDRPSLLTTLARIKHTYDLSLHQVVYDLIPVFQPQAFNEDLFNTYTKNMFEVATLSDSVIAISESSKKDFLRFCDELKIDPPHVSVMRLGDNIPSSENPRAPQGVKSDEQFVISVGTIEARKNHTLLYYTWKEGIRRGVNMPKLVIVGRPGWYTGDIIHSISTDPETREQIIVLNNVSDDELTWLYQNSLFTLYPSYYEGWGLPVAESLSMGKVCLTTNVSSMPEVGGKYCVYHSPFNTHECLEGILLLLNKKKRVGLEKLINNNYSPHSWTMTCGQVKKIVKNR